MDERKPFFLRVISGKDSGRYLISADYQGMKTTDNVVDASRYSARDAYGNVAACIDMLCVCVVPENADAADEDYKAFGEQAARDMLQNPDPKMVELFVAYSCRKSASDPIEEPEPKIVIDKNRPYVSVWEWMHRAWYSGIKANSVPL